MEKFEKATKKLGYSPYVITAAIASDSYTNEYGCPLAPCHYCAYCERFVCEYDAKAEPINVTIPATMQSGKFDLRCNANVVEIVKQGNKVTGVKYTNTLTLEEFIQPADMVVLGGYVIQTLAF